MKKLKFPILFLAFVLFLTFPIAHANAYSWKMIGTRKLHDNLDRTDYIKVRAKEIKICVDHPYKKAQAFYVWEYDPNTYDPKKNGNDEFIKSFKLKNKHCGVVRIDQFVDGSDRLAEIYIVSKMKRAYFDFYVYKK